MHTHLHNADQPTSVLAHARFRKSLSPWRAAKSSGFYNCSAVTFRLLRPHRLAGDHRRNRRTKIRC